MAAESKICAVRWVSRLRGFLAGSDFRARWQLTRAPRPWLQLVLSLLVALAVSLALGRADAAPGNLIAGSKPARIEGVRNAAVLNDGYRASDGDDWNTTLTAVFATGRSFVDYDLGKSTQVVAAYLQGDNNDRYVLSISDDGQRYREIWVAQPVDRPGLQARSSNAVRGFGRYLRVSAREGDGSYSLSELQVFAEQPSVFPPKIPSKGGTNQAPRQRTALLIFALSWAAFLFATDKRSGPVWLSIGALAPAAAGFVLYDTFWSGWPPAAREVALVRAISAAIALLALLRAAAFRIRFPAHRIPVIAGLSVSAALAFGAFYNLGQPQFWNAKESRPEFVHTWDMRVYHPFTKYFEELGYDGVYLASMAAYVEDVPGTSLDTVSQVEIRNLRTHRMQRVKDVQGDILAVSKRFTKERWAEFKADMAYFREVMGPQYLPTHHDHGSNATPVWVLFAKLIFSGRPATEGTLVFGGLVDVFLMAAVFAAMWRCYGLVPALLSIIVFGANDFYMFGTNWGGATLRHDWLAYLAFGVCALKKQRWALGGAFFGLSTMIRAFPGAALIGVVLPALWWAGERWGAKSERPSIRELLVKHQAAVRVLIGAAACMVLTFLLSSVVLGFDAWVIWWKKIILLNADVGLNDISLKSLVGGNDGSVVGTLNNRALLYWAAFFSALAAVGLACRARPLDQAALLALPLIPVLTNPANYYAHFIFLLPLLGTTVRTWQRKAARVAPAEAASNPAESAIPAEISTAADTVAATEPASAPVTESANPPATESATAPVTESANPPATESANPPATGSAVEETRRAEPARRAVEKRATKRARSIERRSEVAPLRLPHLAVSGPLLALCVAQYWTVLDPDIERHFQMACALFFAAMAWLYVRVLREDGVFESGPGAPPPAV
jgi:hypothetical protein